MEQAALTPLSGLRRELRSARPDDSAAAPAEVDPIASVVLEVGLAHLDRPFDYLVPASMAEHAVPGARVSVRFSGQVIDGYVLSRSTTTEHTGALTPLRRVVSSEPVLMPQVATLARAVADRYAGTLADVLRLAIPPRHARAEKRTHAPAPPPPAAPEVGEWSEYPRGPALLHALAKGERPRAVWDVGPAAPWPLLLARLVVATLSAGRGALVVLPDARDVARLDTALQDLLGKAHHVVLQADLGPEARYGRWLSVRRGSVRAVIGTRAAMFAPVTDLGLVVIWDDGDDLHAEPRSPYPHAREVLLLRSQLEATAVVVAGAARTAEAQQLVQTGWAHPVELAPADRRALAPLIHTTGDDTETARDAAARSARLPSLAWRTARSALRDGPVLVQVPRDGYLPAVVCARCRTRATCRACHGPLELQAPGVAPRCRWCATSAAGWGCPECGHTVLRAGTVGARRTAEELGRSFPGVPVLTSGGDHVLDAVGAGSALVVATPGAEPPAAEGYAAALLLDADTLLARPELRAEEEALRRWLGALLLVRPRTRGGVAVIMADPAAAAVQALVRWDPAGFSARELAERAAVHLPPAARNVELRGAAADVEELLTLLRPPAGTETLGPVPAPAPRRVRGPVRGADQGSVRGAGRVPAGGPAPGPAWGAGLGSAKPPQRASEEPADVVQVLLRAPRAVGQDLAVAVRAASGVRSARRSGGTVRVRVDPIDLG